MPAARDERLLGAAVEEEKAFDRTMVVLDPVLQPAAVKMMSVPRTRNQETGPKGTRPSGWQG